MTTDKRGISARGSSECGELRGARCAFSTGGAIGFHPSLEVPGQSDCRILRDFGSLSLWRMVESIDRFPPLTQSLSSATLKNFPFPRPLPAFLAVKPCEVWVTENKRAGGKPARISNSEENSNEVVQQTQQGRAAWQASFVSPR